MDPRSGAARVAVARAAPLTDSVRVGMARLELRRSVNAREHAAAGVLYLSLFDGEVDQRAAAFAERVSARGFESAARDLEPTDAALGVEDGGGVRIARGAACTFPLYWSWHDGRLHLHTQLPLDAGEVFSKTGLIAATAAACLHSSYEPNGFVITPLQRYRRVRRASTLRFEPDGRVQEQVTWPQPLVGGTPVVDPARQEAARAHLVDQLAAACDAYRSSQRHVRSALLEVSGGFDSTLAALGRPPGAPMLGVSAVFPYYEFRHEEGLQLASAQALGIERTRLDGTRLFPYAPCDSPARLDEPALFVTGMRHAEQVARFAADHALETIFMGHGGDQLFATDLTEREQPVENPPGRGPFTAATFRTVARAMGQLRDSPWSHRGTGTFVYDARQDVWVKESFGPTIRTPFSDLALVRVGLAWSAHCKRHGLAPDKGLVADALGDQLPLAIRQRNGKVAYDGVWMRAYALLGDRIATLFERVEPMLTFLGVSVRWLVRRTRALQAFQPVSDREVLALYALASWLAAWGIEHPSRVTWSAQEGG